jgi:acetyl-CoA carboxylase beta subunit
MTRLWTTTNQTTTRTTRTTRTTTIDQSMYQEFKQFATAVDTLNFTSDVKYKRAMGRNRLA